MVFRLGRNVLYALSLGAAALLGGCAEGPGLQEPVALAAAPVQETASVAWDDPVVSRAAYSEAAYPAESYLLDTGDRLRVFVYGQPNLSRLYVVDQSGIVTVPLIGQIAARGLTTGQVAGAIRARLGAQFVRDPQVTVDIQQNRPFFILGEVRNSGQYPFVSGMTVETAVAIAGGYSERASESAFRVTRRAGGMSRHFEVDADFALEPGDTVVVQERLF